MYKNETDIFITSLPTTANLKDEKFLIGRSITLKSSPEAKYYSLIS